MGADDKIPLIVQSLRRPRADVPRPLLSSGGANAMLKWGIVVSLRNSFVGGRKMPAAFLWIVLGVVFWISLPLLAEANELARLNSEVQSHLAAGRFEEAEKVARRYADLAKRQSGEGAELAAAENLLGVIYRNQGRLKDAEAALRHALTIWERRLGPEHPNVAVGLGNLANLLRTQQRPSEAAPLYERSVKILEDMRGPDDLSLAKMLNNLGGAYEELRHLQEAEKSYERSIAIRERHPGQEPAELGTVLANLANLYRLQKRYADAEPLMRRVLSLLESTLGPEHLKVAAAANNLAAVYREQGRFAEAEPLQKRDLEILRAALGPENSATRQSLSNLATLYFEQSRWIDARDLWREVVTSASEDLSKGKDTIISQWPSVGFVKAGYRAVSPSSAGAVESGAETFQAAQLASGSKAATALAQMAVRMSKGQSALGVLIRERQDLAAEWRGRNEEFVAVRSAPPEQRDSAAETALSARLSEIDARLDAIDMRLRQHFPDFARFTQPNPLSIAEVQGLLGEDELLVLFLDTDEEPPTPAETFVWAVGKHDARWVKSDLGTDELTSAVATLRCGLDYHGSWGKTTPSCSALTKTEYSEADDLNGVPLPFDPKVAHSVYQALFGKLRDMMAGKQLVIVPSGALRELPFGVLVDAAPEDSSVPPKDTRKLSWLIRHHAITVLPSVSSLAALRTVARPSSGKRPFVGFGNPLLDGPDATYEESRREAISLQRCAALSVALAGSNGGTARRTLGRSADPNQLRRSTPLPETASELCQVAKDLGAGEADVHLGKRAAERDIKEMSAAGELGDYRIVHFATHGAMSGEAVGSSEAGLVLTPPEKRSELDDGLLTASEIAALKLDADWVILSACNTAAGGEERGEALSGLARGFFYAGGRTLLVSHWYVDSEATVALVTGAIGRLKAQTHIGRAEALRLSMVELIDSAVPEETQPAFWAPFVLVGEGSGAGSRQ